MSNSQYNKQVYSMFFLSLSLSILLLLLFLLSLSHQFTVCIFLIEPTCVQFQCNREH